MNVLSYISGGQDESEKIMNEQMLVKYLLGSVSEKESEQLDEMSVTDDDFAERLRDAENDLVDAYVRGELSGETLASFKSHYLNSARRKNKVTFAETLRDILTAQPEPIEKEDKVIRQDRVSSNYVTSSPKIPFAWKFRVPTYANAMLVLLVLLLIYPSYRSFVREREVETLQHKVANPPKETATPEAPRVEPAVSQPSEPVVSPSFVFPVRAERGEEQKIIRITFDENQTYNLLLSLPSDHFDRYELEIDRQNQNIWRKEIQAVSGETSQLTSLTLHSGFFQEGEYELKISGKQGERRTQLTVNKLMILGKKEK